MNNTILIAIALSSLGIVAINAPKTKLTSFDPDTTADMSQPLPRDQFPFCGNLLSQVNTACIGCELKGVRASCSGDPFNWGANYETSESATKYFYQYGVQFAFVPPSSDDGDCCTNVRNPTQDPRCQDTCTNGGF